MPDIGIVRIPHRFEALEELVGPDRVAEVLLDSRRDTQAIRRAIAEVKSARQGKLLFLLAPSGTGKTSLAESLRIYLADLVGEVLTTPPDYDVPLPRLAGWLSDNLGASRRRAGDRVIVVNLDGREILAVEPAVTRSAMVNLNALLRRNPNVLALWPVVNEDFARQAIRVLDDAGARTSLADPPSLDVVGLERERYFDALNLILTSTSARLADAAIGSEEARDLVDQASNVGDYLQTIHRLVVQRYDIGELGARLPKLFVIVASSADVAEPCRMLRRGNQFLVDPDRLLQYSRANVADDWRRRAADNARRSLPFIASLLEVRLLNLSASAVVNACASFSGDQTLREAVLAHYPRPVSTNAANALRNSALVRALSGLPDVGPSASTSSERIRNAYNELQPHTQSKHRQFNEAILSVLTGPLGLALAGLRFEHHPLDDHELRIDVFVPREERPDALEFTYRRENNASPAVIASYLLSKTQDYARDYGLL
jgi:hypothetical protein